MAVRNKRFLALLSLAAVAGVAGLIMAASPREPSHDGKSLSEWLRILRTATHEKKVSTQGAVRSIGSNAIPILLRKAKARDSYAKKKMQEVLGKRPLHFEIATAESERIDAAIGFSVLGESAASAVQPLAELLNDEETYETAVVSLLAIGPEGVISVTMMLTNPVAARAQFAIANLREIGLALRSPNLAAPDRAAWERKAAIAVPPLVACLKDTRYPFRAEAAFALRVIARQPEVVVPALLEVVQNTETQNELLFASIIAVAEFGITARSARPAIQRFLTNPDEKVRKAATNALAKISADEPLPH